MYLYGKNSVFERLKNNPKSIRKIFLAKDFFENNILKEIEKNKLPTYPFSQKIIKKIKNKKYLKQGIFAEIEEFKYVDFEELLFQKKYTFIFLDRLEDPSNLGVILRNLACLNSFFAVVIPPYEACPVTETVLHIAQGGENYIPVACTNLSKALQRAKEEGYFSIAAVPEEGENIYQVNFKFPLCLVFGSEAKEIRKGIEKYIDLKVFIPMKAKITFNVAMACSFFAYEAVRQKYGNLLSKTT